MGQAQFPSPIYSISHLFEPSAEQFSSEPIKDGIMIAQGVFLPSDVNEIFAQDELLRVYLDKTFHDHINALEQSDCARTDIGPRTIHKWMLMTRDEARFAMVHVTCHFFETVCSYADPQQNNSSISQETLDRFFRAQGTRFAVYTY